jgi:hypothetical protein
MHTLASGSPLPGFLNSLTGPLNHYGLLAVQLSCLSVGWDGSRRTVALGLPGFLNADVREVAEAC